MTRSSLEGLYRGARFGALFLFGVTAAAMPATGQEAASATYAKAGCAACHGPSAEGREGPGLLPYSSDLPELLTIVRQGIGLMPGTPRDEVTDDEVAEIHAYLTSLRPGAAAAAVDPRPAAAHIAASEVAAVVARLPGTAATDVQIRMIDAGGHHVGVGVVQRPAGGGTAIVHDKVTEIYYVLEGAGTLVTGGRLVGGIAVPAESPIVRELAGPSATGRIEAGQSRRVTAGDVVIIPAGVPHGFTDVEGAIRYLVMRVDPERLLAIK